MPQNELVSGGSIFSTWRWPAGKEQFLIQYVPKEEDGATNATNAKNVLSFEGERVDAETMDSLYKQIATRR